MSQKLRVMRILWAAFVMSQLLFAAVAFAIPRAAAAPEPMLAVALGIVSVVVAAVSFVLPRHLLKANLRRLELGVTVGAATPEAGRFGGFYREAAAKERAFADPKRALERAHAPFQTSLILSLALSEAVTLFGVPLAAMGFGPVVFVPFFAVGSVLVLLRFPSATAVGRALERAYDATIGPATS